MPTQQIAVSVVIPTLRRPQLLLRALRSVFSQTFEELEVIVVVDGPDADTVAALSSVTDARLRFIPLEASQTAAGARNIGVAAARGEWIAFLDDDDEWHPRKLERQLVAAQRFGDVLVTCLSEIVTPIATYTWPRQVYDNKQPLDEYLFDKKDAFSGTAFIQTSSYLLRRSLCQLLPFRRDTPHDDWDFLLRLAKESNVRIETVPEILVTVHFEQNRPSLSRVDEWAKSLAWLDQMQPLLTRRAYSGCCLSVIGSRAANEHAFSAFPYLILKAFRHGSPRPVHLTSYLAYWLLPQTARRKLRAIFAGKTTPSGATS